MGAKTSEDGETGGNGNSPSTNKPFRVGGKPRGSHSATDGDGSLGDGDGGNDDDADDDDLDAGQVGSEATVNELNINNTDTGDKRKKPRKRKNKKKKKVLKQTSPPSIKISELFPDGNYPTGDFQDYNLLRTTNEEVRHDERQSARDGGKFLSNYREAAETHRQVRRWVQEAAKPGVSLTELANGIEDGVRSLLGHPGLEPGDSLRGGLGFPTGLCLNHQVAHYTVNPGQKEVYLTRNDVLTVDFGVHINGWIVDSAFTMAFDPVYDDLLAAVKDATNSGIKAAAVDVRICDISAVIQETMESYEVDIRGKTFPVKAVRNLCAHNIHQYRIHGGKSIPFIKNKDQTKLEDGEVVAIETFGTTGRGYTRDDVGIYGYGLNYDAPRDPKLSLLSAKKLYKTIQENFGTLVFSRRYLDRLGLERYLAGMNHLVDKGIVEAYVPLADVKGSYSAQFEHTFLLGETYKEVISRGEDY